MQKIVINTCRGGFGLSKEGKELYASLEDGEDFKTYLISRNDPTLLHVVDKLGKAANGSFAYLRIVEIPNGVAWVIEKYDGIEWIAEKHRTWR
ncbi:hypothetical protein IID24_05340 [Patescibacteria group bacterium]|nr:hypothetical protein [Patescibacteria group bacterium]